MSRSHWIDEFYRKRMERRTFPVEAGEFDEVRALLAKRNGTTGVIGGGGFAKWWLSALIPVIGLLWWAFAGISSDAEVPGSLITEQRSSAGQKVAEKETRWSSTAATQVMSDQSIAPVGTGTMIGEVRTTSVDERVTPVDNEPMNAQVKGTEGLRQTAEAQRPRPKDVMVLPEKGGIEAQVEGRDGTALNERVGVHSDRGITYAHANDQDETWQSLRSGSDQEQADANALGGGRNEMLPSRALQGHDDMIAEVVADGEALRDDQAGSPLDQGGKSARTNDPDEVRQSLGNAVIPEVQSTVAQDGDGNDKSSLLVLDVVSVRSDADEATFIEPRWSLPGILVSPTPEWREIPPFKRLASGQLHFFGAPLAVRTKSSSGGRSTAEAGSLFGLEYRVRVKHLSWATGIYYGSYALKADEGATDVMLNFVEVPMLASYELGMGRFGLMLQGGVSVDLLFNSKGKYPVDNDRVGAGFPDDAFRTLNLSWLLRPQATYQCDERLSVSAGPLWKAQLGAVAKEGSLDGARVTSAGLSIGITWRLEHTTF